MLAERHARNYARRMDADRNLMMTVILVGCGLLVLAWFVAMPWLVSAEKRRQRQRVQARVIGPFDEIFHPSAYQANIVWEVQTEAPAPAPLPGDKALQDGRIVIRVP